ncbi:concanavalin A-like lectin/glucanase domain-containing protein [Radiomyces spectabilis]|uniref:concanavalin A-like lectin/glucanase domain-containing protein n=1 Tax=Radiomyces spectabilis TaxID=64574 RepID=UPI002220100B|nr:concanavalin A-like lectin/glucanase domain-containing protein [Radiomyces spectabilis]KAI8391293.1 concanavalin A-like lectin/glucanase domain-containing protein [Radiomyces spectabilis]
MYGSFRSYMRIPHVNGTVAAMYIYNTKGEIDIEMLSAVKPPQAYFAIHPGLTEHGRASSLTHHNHILGYDPTSDFHEYRIDWLPNLAVFYIDGQEIRRMNTNVPNTIGRLMFSHWTDGNANFSKGPPKETAVLEVANVSVLFKQAVHPLCNGCRLPPEVALLH